MASPTHRGRGWRGGGRGRGGPSLPGPGGFGGPSLVRPGGGLGWPVAAFPGPRPPRPGFAVPLLGPRPANLMNAGGPVPPGRGYPPPLMLGAAVHRGRRPLLPPPRPSEGFPGCSSTATPRNATPPTWFASGPGLMQQQQQQQPGLIASSQPPRHRGRQGKGARARQAAKQAARRAAQANWPKTRTGEPTNAAPAAPSAGPRPPPRAPAASTPPPAVSATPPAPRPPTPTPSPSPPLPSPSQSATAAPSAELVPLSELLLASLTEHNDNPCDASSAVNCASDDKPPQDPSTPDSTPSSVPRLLTPSTPVALCSPSPLNPLLALPASTLDAAVADLPDGEDVMPELPGPPLSELLLSHISGVIASGDDCHPPPSGCPLSPSYEGVSSEPSAPSDPDEACPRLFALSPCAMRGLPPGEPGAGASPPLGCVCIFCAASDDCPAPPPQAAGEGSDGCEDEPPAALVETATPPGDQPQPLAPETTVADDTQPQTEPPADSATGVPPPPPPPPPSTPVPAPTPRDDVGDAHQDGGEHDTDAPAATRVLRTVQLSDLPTSEEKRARMAEPPSPRTLCVSVPRSSPTEAATAPGAATVPGTTTWPSEDDAVAPLGPPPGNPQQRQQQQQQQQQQRQQQPSRKTAKARRRAAAAATLQAAAAAEDKEDTAPAAASAFAFTATEDSVVLPAASSSDDQKQSGSKKRAAEEEVDEAAVEEEAAAEPPKRPRSDVLHVSLAQAEQELVKSGGLVVYRTGDDIAQSLAWSLDEEYFERNRPPPKINYMPVLVTDAEYVRETGRFYQTCINKGFTVRRVARVVNPYLLREFQRRVRDLEAMHGQVTVVRLYHGTKRENIDSICGQNLDVNLAGAESRHTWWGHGVCFTPLSYYSSHYGDKTVNRSVLVCDVVLAKVCSKKHVKDAPLIDEEYLGYLPQGTRYDANMKLIPAAQVLCKFQPHEYYPAYVIDYAAPASGHRFYEPPQSIWWPWWTHPDDLGDVPEMYNQGRVNIPRPLIPCYRRNGGDFNFGLHQGGMNVLIDIHGQGRMNGQNHHPSYGAGGFNGLNYDVNVHAGFNQYDGHDQNGWGCDRYGQVWQKPEFDRQGLLPLGNFILQPRFFEQGGQGTFFSNSVNSFGREGFEEEVENINYHQNYKWD